MTLLQAINNDLREVIGGDQDSAPITSPFVGNFKPPFLHQREKQAQLNPAQAACFGVSFLNSPSSGTWNRSHFVIPVRGGSFRRTGFGANVHFINQGQPNAAGHGRGVSTFAGMSSWVLPSSSRPVFDSWTPPHCLKKNDAPAASHWSRMLSTHPRFIGRAPGPWDRGDAGVIIHNVTRAAG